MVTRGAAHPKEMARACFSTMLAARSSNEEPGHPLLRRACFGVGCLWERGGFRGEEIPIVEAR